MNYVRSRGVRGRSRSRMKVTPLLILRFNYQLIFSLLGEPAVWCNLPCESSRAGSCLSGSFAGDVLKPSSAAAPGRAEGTHRTGSPAQAVTAAGDKCPEQQAELPLRQRPLYSFCKQPLSFPRQPWGHRERQSL